MDDQAQADIRQRADALRTIIQFHDWQTQVDRAIDARFARSSPIEFLCLSVVPGKPRQFVTLNQAQECLKHCRAREKLNVQLESGRPYLPLNFLIATNMPPAAVSEWREDCKQRDLLTHLGALLLDRPEVEPLPNSDDELFLDYIGAIIHIIGVQTPSSGPNGFDFDWEPHASVPPAGQQYSHQPPGISPPSQDPDFAKRFEIYSQESPDMEF